jgi:2'-5' RNA ligase
MARFVVVLPLAPLVAGDEFTVADWPLHVTLVEPFQTGRDAGDVARIIGDAVAGAEAVSATAGEEALFGRRRNVPVTVVRDSGALVALRESTLAALRHAGVDVARSRLEFRPHVTHKRHGRLRLGERVDLRVVALIDMRPAQGAHYRRVVGTWPLRERV